MPKAKCPQCATVVEYVTGYDPVCPSCGFRGGAPAPAMVGFSAPPSDLAPPQTQGANSMAIAALVCGCAGFLVGITAPIAIVLGAIALNQNPDASARTMAIVGIVLGSILTIGFLLLMLFFFAVVSSF